MTIEQFIAANPNDSRAKQAMKIMSDPVAGNFKDWGRNGRFIGRLMRDLANGRVFDSEVVPEMDANDPKHEAEAKRLFVAAEKALKAGDKAEFSRLWDQAKDIVDKHRLID